MITEMEAGQVRCDGGVLPGPAEVAAPELRALRAGDDQGVLAECREVLEVRQDVGQIPYPVMIAVLLYVESALIFGAIAAAAVFVSGKSGFKTPVLACALIGGALFPFAYWAMNDTLPFEANTRTKLKWWFTKRFQKAAVVDDPSG